MIQSEHQEKLGLVFACQDLEKAKSITIDFYRTLAEQTKSPAAILALFDEKKATPYAAYDKRSLLLLNCAAAKEGELASTEDLRGSCMGQLEGASPLS